MVEIPNCFYRTSARALIFDQKGRLLITKTPDGSWNFPWWWIEFWESPQEALIRELKEEMHLSPLSVAKDPSAVYLMFNESKGFWMNHIFFEVTIDEKQLESFTPTDEIIDFWFFTEEESQKLYLRPIVKWYWKHLKEE